MVRGTPAAARRLGAEGVSKEVGVVSSCGRYNFKEIVPQNNNPNNNHLDKVWSQQCGPNCGCMLRMQVQIDPSTHKICSVEYHTKSLLLEKKAMGKMNRREMQENGQWMTVTDTVYQMIPLHTSRSQSRPMITSCNCGMLKRLANAVCTYLANHDVHSLRKTVEFTSTRASPAFRQHVLNLLGANEYSSNSSASKCFDLVEEVLIGLVRGYEMEVEESTAKRYTLNDANIVAAQRTSDLNYQKERSRVEPKRYAIQSNNTPISIQAANESNYGVHEEYLDWLSFVDDNNNDYTA